MAREPHMKTIRGRQWTLLDCQLGGHTGVFPISRYEMGDAAIWACDDCAEARGLTSETNTAKAPLS